jgi:hypothetical protein
MQDGVYDAFTKQTGRDRRRDEGRRRVRAGAVIGPLIDMKGGRQGRGAHRRRGQEGRQGSDRRQARRSGGGLFELTVLTDVTGPGAKRL